MCLQDWDLTEVGAFVQEIVWKVTGNYISQWQVTVLFCYPLTQQQYHVYLHTPCPQMPVSVNNDEICSDVSGYETLGSEL